MARGTKCPWEKNVHIHGKERLWGQTVRRIKTSGDKCPFVIFLTPVYCAVKQIILGSSSVFVDWIPAGPVLLCNECNEYADCISEDGRSSTAMQR
jgi:hypothetical protein